MAEIEKMNLESEDLVEDRLAQLKELMPEVFTESGIDFDKLRLELGDEVDEGQERYAFTWPGKMDAIRQSQTPSTATLRPCVEKSRGRDGEDGSFDSDNIYIEGDNLEVLKLLQSGYHGKVKMIYIDPPYNTGKDFVYKDQFGDTIENYKTQAGLANQSNADTSGRYHSDWCAMMYPRLRLARELLNGTGVIAVSIDDNELTNTLRIIEEVFGEKNILAVFPRVTKKAGKSSEALAKNHDYVVLAAKSSSVLLYPPTQNNVSDYPFKDEYFDERGPYKLNQCLDYDSLQYSSTLDYPIEIDGEVLYPGGDRSSWLERQAGNYSRADWAWRWSREKYDFGRANGFIVIKHGKDRTRIYTKTYLNATISEASKGSKDYAVEIVPRTVPLSTLEYINNQYSNDNASKGLAALFDNAKGLFDYSKPVSLIQSLVNFTTKDGDIVLDFFSGSGTTAQAVMKENLVDSNNRRFILVQLPEPFPSGSVALKKGYRQLCELGEQRIRYAGDSIKRDFETQTAQLRIDEEFKKLPDIGFRVFSLDNSGIEKPKPGQLMLDVVKPDRSDMDIVFEMMLKWGLELTLPVEKEEVAGYPVYSVACGELVCCLADGLTMEVLDAIADMEPRRVLMRDSILTDTLKLNAVQAFRRVEERAGYEVQLRTV